MNRWIDFELWRTGLEARLLELAAAHDQVDHAHVHDGYVTTDRIRAEVETCLGGIADELEAENEDKPAEEEKPTEEEKPAEEPKKEEPEKGPEDQKPPKREHGLHRRVGGKKAA